MGPRRGCAGRKSGGGYSKATSRPFSEGLAGEPGAAQPLPLASPNLSPASPAVCQNCVELDPATLAGIIVTDVLATVLLALGVYCFAGHEAGRLSRGEWRDREGVCGGCAPARTGAEWVVTRWESLS